MYKILYYDTCRDKCYVKRLRDGVKMYLDMGMFNLMYDKGLLI